METVVTRRQQLTEIQRAAPYDAPAEQRELVRHYTLSQADLAAVGRCRGDHNRLSWSMVPRGVDASAQVLGISFRQAPASGIAKIECHWQDVAWRPQDRRIQDPLRDVSDVIAGDVHTVVRKAG